MFFVVAVVFSRIPAVHNRTRLQNINTLALNYAITISCLIIIVSTHIISITFKHTSARTAIAETRCGDRVPACARNTGSCKRLDAIYSERIAKQSMLARIQSAGARTAHISAMFWWSRAHIRALAHRGADACRGVRSRGHWAASSRTTCSSAGATTRLRSDSIPANEFQTMHRQREPLSALARALSASNTTTHKTRTHASAWMRANICVNSITCLYAVYAPF